MGGSEPDQPYRQYFEESPIGVFVTNEVGEYVEVNERAGELVGYSRSELLSMSVDDLVPDYDDPGEISSFQTVKSTGRIRTEVQLLHRDGHTVDVSLDAVALDGGRFIAYCQDISEEKEFERRLKEQLDDLKVLNQILRHDIRNDLQLVMAYAQLTAERVEDDTIEQYMETVLENADHAATLTTTAGQMAEVMATEQNQSQPIDLRNVLRTEVEEVRSAYSKAVIDGVSDIPAVTISANEMVGSIFRNLLKNAIQHNDKDIPEVRVSATEHDERVVVRVADNGPGIPDDRKDRIFGKGQTGPDSQGTGLGLYLVKTLIDEYGGDGWVEDNDPRGAVFAVELPKAT